MLTEFAYSIFLFVYLFVSKICGEGREYRAGSSHPRPQDRRLSDCPERGVWEQIGVGMAMFDRGVMTSGVFHRPSHCTCSRWSSLERGNYRVCLGQIKVPAHVDDLGWAKLHHLPLRSWGLGTCLAGRWG